MMTTNTIAIPSRVVLREATIALGLVALTTAAAKLAVYLPFTPVPATLQVAAVLFAGAAFGPWRGAWSQLLYLGLGFGGMPVFAAIPTAATVGYLLAFPLAAFLAGRFAHSTLGRWLGAYAGLAVIYALGTAWLFTWTVALGHVAAGEQAVGHWVLLAGVWPFLPLDVAKSALAVVSAKPIRQRLNVR